MSMADPNKSDTTRVPHPTLPANAIIQRVINDVKQFQQPLFDGVNWNKTYRHTIRILPKKGGGEPQDCEGSARPSPSYEPINEPAPEDPHLAQVDDNAQRIKRLVKDQSKKLLKEHNLQAQWRSIVRICPTTQGLQDVAGCGCGCS